MSENPHDEEPRQRRRKRVGFREAKQKAEEDERVRRALGFVGSGQQGPSFALFRCRFACNGVDTGLSNFGRARQWIRVILGEGGGGGTHPVQDVNAGDESMGDVHVESTR